MPWEKNFDKNEALEKIMKVFWEKGYEATSITDHTEATDVKRQSLYNTFGNKRKLFIQALLKFYAERQQEALASFESRGTPKDSIMTILTQAAEDPRKRGCFLTNTALQLHAHDEEVKKLVATAVEDFRKSFERLIEHGKMLGEISSTVDTTAAASGLVAALYGIRALGRGAADKKMLRQVADQALRLLS